MSQASGHGVTLNWMEIWLLEYAYFVADKFKETSAGKNFNFALLNN